MATEELAKKWLSLGKTFDMKVTGIRRNPEECDYADEVLSIDALEGLLLSTDFLVMVLPDSESTTEISWMQAF